MNHLPETLDRLERTLAYSRANDYAGYDYADGMSSRLLSAIPIEHPYLNLAFQETIKRTPLNVRPLFLVPKRRSFKGTALFIAANLTAFNSTGDDQYRQEALRLGRWLVANRRDEPFGWGHNHRLQTLDGVVERNTPSIVTTVFAIRSLLRLRDAGMTLPIDIPADLHSLVVDDLDWTERDVGASISYRVDSANTATILNANALAGAILAEVAQQYNREDLLERSEQLLTYVASHQTESGGWQYTDPQTASHLGMDSHHNGFILESYLRYRQETGSHQFDTVIDRSIEFHREHLFAPDGTPYWDASDRFPHDIHAAAQGIITFAHIGDIPFARSILEWIHANLYRGEGQYAYRKGRFLTRRFTLMRWAQAWMAKAIATLLDSSRHIQSISKPSVIVPQSNG